VEQGAAPQLFTGHTDLVTLWRRRNGVCVGCFRIQRIINLLTFMNLCKLCLITTEAGVIISCCWDLNYMNLYYFVIALINRIFLHAIFLKLLLFCMYYFDMSCL
jgi:hypothetical protein